MHCARTPESTERERETHTHTERDTRRISRRKRERDHQGAPSATITNYSMVDL